MQQLLVATHNQGKVREYAEMLSDLQVDWLSLDDTAVSVEVPETADTFYGNARLKAVGYAKMTGLLTLADDSGLEVAALDGRPGVHTAYYGGPGLNHRQRYEALLAEMADVPLAERAAQFRCVILLADPVGNVLGDAEGICPGQIAMQPAGDGGFGYDPIFYLPEQGATMAQVPAAVKNQISHRARALQRLAPKLRELGLF